ncbi:MAG: hypothetical protein AAGF11_30080 [Myxococcota bacterium]
MSVAAGAEPGLVDRRPSCAHERRPRAMSAVATLGLVVGLGVGCNLSIDENCQPGTEGCPCTADLQCLTGLTCLSSYCVDPNKGDDGAGDASAGDDGSASDGGDTGDGNGSDNGDGGDGDTGDGGTGDGGTDNGGDNNNDGGDNGGAIDNVGACEEWIDASDCGEYDWSSVIDCSIYADLPCNINDYFNCLTDNTSCVEGIPDTSGWANCYQLATCV